MNSNPTEEDWLDKNVGIKGSHISGGQKQRVAILRALYRDPSIYLLDEATSALDSKNEEMALKSIMKAAKGKTIVNVTHKLDILRDYDLILVFKEGEIVEKGTFEQLLSKKK